MKEIERRPRIASVVSDTKPAIRSIMHHIDAQWCMRVGRTWPVGGILTLCPRNAVIPLGKRDCLADMNLLSRDQFLLIATRGDG